jgi:hypothetical protein
MMYAKKAFVFHIAVTSLSLVVTTERERHISLGRQIDTHGANDTLANQSKEGNVRPSVRKAVRRRKRVYGKGDRRVTRWFWPVGANWILIARDRPAVRDSKDADVVRMRYISCTGKVRANEE